jgi:hypothetical protein
MKTNLSVLKKTFSGVAVALGILLSGSLVAQEQQTVTENTLSPKFGIKGGLNLTNLYIDDVKDENMKAGFNAGLFAKLPVTRGFSIQPELLYSNKGAKVTYDNLFGEGTYRFNLHYIELPLLGVINVAKNFNIHAGPYISYLAGANVTEVDKNEGTVEEVAELDADNFHRIDYGVAGGFGIDVQNFTIGARYNYGLHEIGKSGSVSGQATKNSKNSAINVYLGFAF